MVALLVRLKLTLLRNSLRRSVWRTVGLVIGMVYGLAAVAAAIVGFIALRHQSVELTADITVIGFAVITLAWLLMSLLVFGVDETVDPAKFALLPVTAQRLLPGLLICGLLGVPGLMTALIALGSVIAWSRSPAQIVTAVLAALLGIATCVLLSRAATSAFAAVLSSRRFRDLALVVLALFGASMGVGGNLIGAYVGSDPSQLRAGLAGVARVTGWTPFGWAWSVPAEVARGAWAAAGVRLILAVGLVAVLWFAWAHFLAVRLTSPTDAGGPQAKAGGGGWISRLYPDSPAGGVAVRTLRYWRRDPRYLAGIAGFLVAPVIIVVTQLTSPNGPAPFATLAPTLVALLVGASLAQDLSFDGSAIWLHVSAGLRGADDRAGRMMSTATVYLPLMVLLLLATCAMTDRWSLLPVSAGLSFGIMLNSLGVGSVVGTLWQWSAPPPGANPFQRGNSGGLPSLLSLSVTTGLTIALSLPIIGLAIGSIWVSWLGWLVLPVGLVIGVIAVRLGIRHGGRLLDRRWPEVLRAVSEKAA